MFRIRLKELREAQGLSQYAFADKIHVAQSTVGSWEAGRREPSFSMMQVIADFFGVSVDYLLGRKQDTDDSIDDESPNIFSFRVRLKNLREARELSQYAFARAFGVAQSTVGNWESGTREPNFETLERIADYFDVTVDYLLGRDQKTENKPTTDNDDGLTDIKRRLIGKIKIMDDDSVAGLDLIADSILAAHDR